MSQHAGAAADAVPEGANQEVLVRIGHMTRALHDSLRGLGLDKLIEKAASDIPDARDRLSYVAKMSEQAAQRVLNATDAVSPLQDRIAANAGSTAASWQALVDSGAVQGPARELALQTIAHMGEAQADTAATRAYLMDIMMAQDFQDLTGQVISRVTTIAQNLEQQLVQMLVDFAPADVKREFDNSLLNGPQIKPEGNNDVVANQDQVDDLLDSLGF